MKKFVPLHLPQTVYHKNSRICSASSNLPQWKKMWLKETWEEWNKMNITCGRKEGGTKTMTNTSNKKRHSLNYNHFYLRDWNRRPTGNGACSATAGSTQYEWQSRNFQAVESVQINYDQANWHCLYIQLVKRRLSGHALEEVAGSNGWYTAILTEQGYRVTRPRFGPAASLIKVRGINICRAND